MTTGARWGRRRGGESGGAGSGARGRKGEEGTKRSEEGGKMPSPTE